MLKKNYISFLYILLSCYSGHSQTKNLLKQERKIATDSIDFIQVKTASLFNSKQINKSIDLTKNFF